MASSESMDTDESFRARVDKVFGSLASSKSSPAWSLTDGEVERREWRRDTDTSERDETPCSSSFDGFLTKDRKVSRRNRRKDFDDDTDVDGGGEQGHDGTDDWEIRSSIGLDPTVDREEEEDEYDRVACGMTNATDRLYMKDVNDHGPYLNSHSVLPKTRDTRANHLAAKIRLKEDEDEANSSPSKPDVTELEEAHTKASEHGCKPKSILKRKDSDTVLKSRKRVRFNPGLEDDSEVSPDPFVAPQNEPAETQNGRGVPNYLLNPSKYKCYTFDSSVDVDEASNTEACMAFLKQVGSSKGTEFVNEVACASAELPKSVTFIPKKKGDDPSSNNSEVKQCKEDHGMQSISRAGHPVGIAAREVELDETSAMDEDAPEANAADNAADKDASSQKPGRRYRTLSRSDDSES